MGYRKFRNNQSGAVIIEAAFVLVLAGILLQVLIEFSVRKINQTELERINFALAKVVRERRVLFNITTATPQATDVLASGDVIKLFFLAKSLLNNSSSIQKNITLKVEATMFNTDPTQPKPIKTLTFTINSSCNIKHTKPLSAYSHLSALSGNGRWMPIYRVSLCVPRSVSAIEKTINRSLGFSESIVVSNIVISR